MRQWAIRVYTAHAESSSQVQANTFAGLHVYTTKQEYRTVSYLLPQDDLSDNKLMASWRRSAVAAIQLQ